MACSPTEKFFPECSPECVGSATEHHSRSYQLINFVPASELVDKKLLLRVAMLC